MSSKFQKPEVILDPKENCYKFIGPSGATYTIPYNESYRLREFSYMARIADLIGVDPKSIFSTVIATLKIPEYPPVDISSLKEIVSNPKMSLVDKFNLLRKEGDVLRGFLREKLRTRLLYRLKKETFDDPLEAAKTYEVAEEIVRAIYDLGFRFIKTPEGNLFIYDRGQLITYEVIAEELLALFGVYRATVKNELNTAIKVHAETVDPLKFNPRDYILCNNYILDIWEMKALDIPPEPNPDFLFTFRLDWNINPEAPAGLDIMDLEGWRQMIPKTLEFLERLFPEKEIDKVLEMLGALVIPSYVRKIWLIIGPPGVGKSVFKEFLLEVFKPASSSFSLDWITESEFNFPLLGKLINISSEGARSLISAKGIERLKRYSGEETIHFEEKYRPPLIGRNIIKMVFLLNEYPQFQYLDEGFLDRLYIIETTTEKVKEPKPEPQILKALLEEKDAFAAFLLWCMKRLLKEGYLQFKHDFELEEKKELFAYALNPVAQWIKEECVREGRTERKELYAAYLKWAQINAKPAISDKHFYNMLRSLGFTERKTKGEYFFENLRLKQAGEESRILKHTACEKCGRIGVRQIVREDGVHYLCENCLRNWEGNL